MNNPPIVYCSTAVSRLAASLHWSASGSWHRTRGNILNSGQCVKHSGHWTLNWLLILLIARTIQKTEDLNSGSRMPPTVGFTSQDLQSAPASEAYVERVFSVCGQLTAGKRHWLTRSLEKRIMLKMKLKYTCSARFSPQAFQLIFRFISMVVQVQW